MPAALIVSVDTEEEFDWSTVGSSPRWSLEHIRSLPRFQQFCERLGVRPTYLIDYPVATSPEAIAILHDFQRRNACEIGAHLHPWVNPPIDEQLSPRNTFLCNLPLDLQKKKVLQLTAAIERAFGGRPTSFKAGRYGIDFRLAPYLYELGYTVDSSVIAYSTFTDEQGPDFSKHDPWPFWIRTDDTAANDSASLLEIPCTVGFNRRPFRRSAQWHRRAAHPRLRSLHPVGVLDRTRILRKIVLSPELSCAADLKRLMQVMARDENAVFNLTLHSPSLEAGHTPFVRTDADSERFYDSLELAFEFAIGGLRAQPLTLSEYRNHFLETAA